MNDLIKNTIDDHLTKIVEECRTLMFHDPNYMPDVPGYTQSLYEDLEVLNKLPKRRPYLFLITTQHNDEFTMNSMVYYLEPNQDPKEFKEESAAHLRSVYGSGTISLRSIKL